MEDCRDVMAFEEDDWAAEEEFTQNWNEWVKLASGLNLLYLEK